MNVFQHYVANETGIEMLLGFLRALIGCWHDWDRWQRTTATEEGDDTRRPAMERECKKCGKPQIRWLSIW